METGKIHIKNMVCPRCIMSVREIFRKNGIEPAEVDLGTVTLDSEAQEKIASGDALIGQIKRNLEELGFEMIDDKRMQIVESIRTGVIEFVHNPEIQDNTKLSEYLQRKCLKEYSALSVEAQYLYSVKKLFNVPARSFNPSPNVDSIIIQFERKDVQESKEDIKDFFSFVKVCFKQRRKTIYNNLKEIMDGEQAMTLLEKAGIEPSRRAQELTTEQLKAIYEAGK